MSTDIIKYPSYAKNMLLNLPAEMRDVMLKDTLLAMESFGGGYNWISMKRNVFHVFIGGQEVDTRETLEMIILKMAQEDHITWYKSEYNSKNSDNVPPDAIWAANEEPPAHVPPSLLVKRPDGRNPYAIKRRTVVALVNETPTGEKYIDFENPFILDVGSMSLYGKALDLPGIAFNQAYGLRDYMKLLIAKEIPFTACLTKAIFDEREDVPVIRFIPGVVNGQVQVLDDNSLRGVYGLLESKQVIDFCDWRANKTSQPESQPEPQPEQQPQPQQPQPQQQEVRQPQTFDQQPVQQFVQQPVQQFVQQPVQTFSQPQQPVNTGAAFSEDPSEEDLDKMLAEISAEFDKK